MGGGILLLAKPVVISAVQAGKAEERPLTPDVRESAGSEGKQGAERHRVACDGVRREDERAAAHRLRAPRGVWVGAHCERSSDQNLDSPTGASRGWRHAARVRKNRTACSSAHFTRIRAPQPTRSGARATFVHGHVGQSAFHPAATLRVDWRAKAVPVSEGDPSDISGDPEHLQELGDWATEVIVQRLGPIRRRFAVGRVVELQHEVGPGLHVKRGSVRQRNGRAAWRVVGEPLVTRTRVVDRAPARRHESHPSGPP